MNPELQQVLSICIPLLSPLATLAIVMVGFIYNNARMNLRDLFRAELKAEISVPRCSQTTSSASAASKIAAENLYQT